MTVDTRFPTRSSSEPLLAKLEEPRVAAALQDLLDHADLLAILVVGLDGLMRRGDEISATISKAIGELRVAAAGSSESLRSLDLPKLAGSLRVLSAAVADATPGLEALLRSDLTDPRMIEAVSMVSRSVIRGTEQAKTEPLKPNGVLPLLRALKDEEVARGLGFLLQVARALGRELDQA